jgi:GNAT superfamily N-acetyltransferase
MILYSCPLSPQQFNQKPGFDVERVDGTTLSKEDCAGILNIWNPSLKALQMSERFAAGCELWLAKVDGRLAGFGWSLQGRTMEPYFFKIQPDDVHLFDFFVFPAFRGRGINVALVMDILSRLGREGVHCAYIECAAWNDAQRNSLSKTKFRSYATASKFRFWGKWIVIWHDLLQG